MDLGNGLGHLTYSTLVHPADDWEQLYNSLVTYLPKVKARIAGNRSFGVCIRLSASSAQTLANSAAERDKLKKFLDDNDMYIYTANAFPYGAFKGTVVKEQVYEPDWRSEERTHYTINVADVLADVCPRRHRAVDPERAAWLQAAGDRQRSGQELHRSRAGRRRAPHRARRPHRAHRAAGARAGAVLFSRNHRRDRSTISRDHLYSGAAVEKLAKLAHVPIAEANEALRRHLGIVYDICHQAVEYENISQSVQKLIDAGIPIFKFQEAAALHIPEVTQPSSIRSSATPRRSI